MEAISLPPQGTRSTPLSDVSDKLKDYIENYKTKMLRAPREMKEIYENNKRDGKVPYVDPVIKENIMELAARVAENGMLRGVRGSIMEVGLFTIV